MILGLLLLVTGILSALLGCAQEPCSSHSQTLDSPLITADAPIEKMPLHSVVVCVNAEAFVVEVADDATEREIGLSGRDSLGKMQGMWFAYPVAGEPSFWMRDMQFAIDIVWVDAELRVVSVTHEAPAPIDGAPLDLLPRYSPDEPVMYVLEINAGLAHDLGIEEGALVSFIGK